MSMGSPNKEVAVGVEASEDEANRIDLWLGDHHVDCKARHNWATDWNWGMRKKEERN